MYKRSQYALFVGLIALVPACSESDGTGSETDSTDSSGSGTNSSTSTDTTGTDTESGELGIEVDTTRITVVEGATASFEVKLSAAPTGSKTVSISRASGGDLDLTLASVSTLTFTETNWSTPQVVRIAAALDDDSVNGTATFNVSSAGLTTRIVTAVEDDTTEVATPELVLTPAALSVNEGDTATFTVALSSAPAALVNVMVDHTAGDADISVAGGAMLAFTASNWQLPQTVTIESAVDADAENGVATLTVSGDGLAAKEITATEVDTTVLGIAPSVPTLAVAEGATANFTVKLTAPPAADTTVTVTKAAGGDADLTVMSGASLVFTPSNWNTAQDVVIAAAADADAVDGTATFEIASAGLATQSVVANEMDAAVQGLLVAPSAVTVEEAGTATFTVALTAEPSASVEVTVAREAGGDEDLKVKTGDTLTFTTANWQTPQTVTLEALADADAVDGTANFLVASTGLDTKTVAATEDDTTVQELVVTPASLEVPEAGSADFKVKLSAKPQANVEVDVKKDNNGDVDLALVGTGKLTFTPANWDTEQDVTVTAAADDDGVDGTASFTVSSTGLTSKVVSASEVDDDEVEFAVSTTSLMVLEDATADFTVNLTAQPAADLTVTVSKAGSGDQSISLSSNETLTFTTMNWKVPQTVTVAAVEDVDDANGIAKFDLTATGVDKKTVTVTEADIDRQGIFVSSLAVAVPEGFTSSFFVRLTQQPGADVSVSVARTDGDDDVRVESDSSLTFTSADWNQPQQVTLRAFEDTGSANSTAQISLTSSGLTTQEVTATEVDND